jgi:hypothetical protein
VTKPFKQYVFPRLIDGDGKPRAYGFRTRGTEDEKKRMGRIYSQALGFSVDNPQASVYAVAKHLRETVWPEVLQETAEAAVRRWRKLPHWKQYER